MISNNEKREQIVKLFKEENRTPKSLSEEFGVPISTIYVWVRDGRRYTTLSKEDISKMYLEDHMTPHMIREETHLPLKAIYDFLSKSGVELTEEEKKEYADSARFNKMLNHMDELKRLREENTTLKEQNKVLQDSLKYLTELLNIKNEELKKS